MIIDAHAHAWRRWPYDPEVPDPRTRGSAEALLYEMDRHRIDHAVVVAAAIGGPDPRTVNDDNNDYVATLARTHPDRLSMVADLGPLVRPTESPDKVDATIAALTDAGAIGFTRYHAPDADWLGTGAGRAVFAAAAAYGLFASLPVTPNRYAEVAAAGRRHPQTPILLHHQGFATDDDGVRALQRLAIVPNLYLKVSGFHYLADRTWRYPFPTVTARLEQLVDAFGPHRLVWGSDSPVAQKYISYRQALEIVRERCTFLAADDLRLIMGETMHRLLQETRVRRAGVQQRRALR